MFSRLSDTARSFGVSAAAAGAACAFVSLAGIALFNSTQSLLQQDQLVVDTTAWRSALHLHWDFEKLPTETTAAITQPAAVQPPTVIADEIRQATAAPERKLVLESVQAKKKLVQVHRKARSVRVAQVPVIAPLVPNSPRLVVPSEQDERQKFQSLTAMLRQRFQVAMNVAPKLDTQIVFSAAAPESPIKKAPRKAPEQKVNAVAAAPQKEKKQEETPIVEAEEVEVPVTPAYAQVMNAPSAAPQLDEPPVSIQMNTQKAKLPANTEDFPTQEQLAALAKPQQDEPRRAEVRQDPPVETAPQTEAPPPTANKTAEAGDSREEKSSAASSILMAPTSVGKVVVVSTQPKVSIQPHVATQNQAAKAGPQNPQDGYSRDRSPQDHSKKEPGPADKQNPTPPTPPKPPAPSPACSIDRKFTEALSPTQLITIQRVEDVSKEGAPDSACAANKGWKLATSPMHWATLFWGTETQVPMLSGDEALFMALGGGNARLQSGMGVVLGRVAAGWSVSLSDRADRVLYFDDAHKTLNPADTSSTRNYVFLNVSPGAHIIHFTSQSGVSTAAAGIPVLASTVTAVNGGDIQIVRVTGKVLDAEASDELPMRNVHVRVVGQSANAFTAADGKFDLGTVYRIGTLPLQVETESKESFTHRYRADVDSATDLRLFRFSERQIQGFLSQLQGGVRAETGLVLAAAPHAAMNAQNDDARVFPEVRAMAETEGAGAEVYVVNSRNELVQKAGGLGEGATRFISVEVPEGPALMELSDKNHVNVAAEVLYASPGVINVVGPY